MCMGLYVYVSLCVCVCVHEHVHVYMDLCVYVRVFNESRKDHGWGGRSPKGSKGDKRGPWRTIMHLMRIWIWYKHVTKEQKGNCSGGGRGQ